MKKKEKTIRVYRRGTRERKKRSDLHSQEQILIGPEREREREREDGKTERLRRFHGSMYKSCCSADKKKKEEKKEEPTTTPEDTTLEIKKYEYIPYSSVSNYVYPPQLFSDENPNACSIM